MTPRQDLFVGLMAVAVGGWLVWGAVFDSVLLMSLAKSRLLADSIGRRRTRWVIALVGAGCIAVGCLIASGWRVRW